jgi:hypothetical protein
MAPPIIAVYGATGHTGRLVAAELLARDQPMVVAGRDPAGIRELAVELGVPGHVAALDDPAAVRSLLDGCAAVVHCAGPFAHTGWPLASAAVEAGVHYVDHALEQHHVKRLFDELDRPARVSGSVVVPGASFYGGFGDLLADAVGLPEIDRLVIGYAVTGWRMTAGARATADMIIPDGLRVTHVDGVQEVRFVEPRTALFPFPPPLGPQPVIAPVPYFETITVPRNLPVRTVEAQITTETLGPQTFDGQDVDAATRADTDYTVAVQAVTADGTRWGQVSGHDIWRAAALVSVEVALALVEDPGPERGGVFGPAGAVHAVPLLRRLEELGALTASPGLLAGEAADDGGGKSLLRRA